MPADPPSIEEVQLACSPRRIRALLKRRGLKHSTVEPRLGAPGRPLAKALRTGKAPRPILERLASLLFVPVERILHEERQQTNAFLFLTDIVGFSELRTGAQIATVDHLLDGLWSLPLMERFHDLSRHYLNSTGDGFLLALPAETAQDALALCSGAHELVARCRTPRSSGVQPYQIRAGLHIGTLWRNNDLPTDSFAVGTGLNHVARVANAAGDSQVLVSEDFAGFLYQNLPSPPADDLFWPAMDRDPLAVPIKHGRMANLRILPPRRSTTGKAPPPPPKLARVSQADDELGKGLRVVRGSLLSILGSRLSEPELERLDPRLTLWAPRKQWLERLPWALAEDSSDREPSSKTRYEWSKRAQDKGQPVGQGPVARAFESGVPQLLVGLPPWTGARRNKDRYRAAWDAVGVPADCVNGFSRYARCVLAVPLTFARAPAGVLCIDLAEPLDKFEALLEQFCALTQEESGEFLGTRLLLRVS